MRRRPNRLRSGVIAVGVSSLPKTINCLDLAVRRQKGCERG